MKLEYFESVIVKSVCNLDSLELENLDGNSSYSYMNKEELISYFNKMFQNFKSDGITELRVKNSFCNHCYPDANSYSFFFEDYGLPILKLVLLKENSGFFRLEECKNEPAKNNSYGLPF